MYMYCISICFSMCIRILLRICTHICIRIRKCIYMTLSWNRNRTQIKCRNRNILPIFRFRNPGSLLYVFWSLGNVVIVTVYSRNLKLLVVSEKHCKQLKNISSEWHYDTSTQRYFIIIIIIKKEKPYFYLLQFDVYHSMLCLLSSTGKNPPNSNITHITLSMMSKGQCCGSETFYSGSGSDLGKVSDPYSDPDPYHIWHSIYKKKSVQDLAFLYLKQHCCPESCHLIF